LGELNLLFVSDRGGRLYSAQLVFNGDHTLRSLDCAQTFSKAAEFLLNHPRSVILCEAPSEGNCSSLLDRLISSGSPAVLITMHAARSGTVSADVHVYQDGEILRELFIDSDVMRTIGVAWQYCKEMASEPHSVSRKPDPLHIM
jgi:hypothetical protein